MNTITVQGRDALAAAIRALPLEVDTVIILERKGGRTRYTFPAVCHADGAEVEPHMRTERRKQYIDGRWVEREVREQIFPDPMAPALWQVKRRERIAQNVAKRARGCFE